MSGLRPPDRAVEGLLCGAVLAIMVPTVVAACGARWEQDQQPRRSPARVNRVPAARFEQLPTGWREFAREGTLTRRGADSETIVTSWRYESSPHGPAAEMPKRGVIVSVLLIRRWSRGQPPTPLCHRAPRLRPYRPFRRMPLQLPGTLAGTLEGYDNVPEYRLFGAIRNDYNVEVRVDINQPSPSRRLLRKTQAVLDQLHFAKWPNRC